MRRQSRPGFTLFQLLVVLAVLLLLLTLLPLAIAKARAEAERARKTNNLKQLLLAVHNHHDANGRFPAGVDDNHFSATSKLLPFIEQKQVFNKIDFKKSIDDEANAATRKLRIKMLLSESDPIASAKDEWGATNYLFNDKVFFLNSKIKFTDILDGTSNTVFIGETLKGDGKDKGTDVRRQYVLLKKEDLKSTSPNTGLKYFKDGKNIAGDRCASWMDGRFLQGTFNGRLMPNDERPDVNCGGISGVSTLRSFDEFILVGLGDGSTRTLKNTISRTTWDYSLDPADGMVLGTDF